tara:strand:+ start:1601 stop:2227 length:627 start_codon:yes stop_codon:yes gene_type:complete
MDEKVKQAVERLTTEQEDWEDYWCYHAFSDVKLVCAALETHDQIDKLDEFPAPNEPHVMYSTDGDGRWRRVEWAKQCSEEVFFREKCQGVEGHAGVHWRYDDNGSFKWDENKAEMTEEELADKFRGCSGSTPPGHKEYINPVDKRADYYMEHSTVTDVEDPEIIALLEKNEPPEEHASINRPCSEEQIKELELQDRIPPRDRDKGETK